MRLRPSEIPPTRASASLPPLRSRSRPHIPLPTRRRALAGLLCLLASRAEAQEPTGESLRSESSTVESATFLVAPIGARAVGLGGAVAASRGVAEAILWNPAAAAALEETELYYVHSNDFATESDVFGAVWRSRVGQLGFAYYLFDLGSIETTSGGGQRTGDLELKNEAFIFSLGLPVRSGVEAGFSYKLVRFSSDCSGACGEFDFGATGHAFDAGLILSGPRHALGVVLRNAGSGLSLGGDAPSDPLPTRLRLGVSLELLGERTPAGGAQGELPLRVSVSADLEEPLTEFDDLDFFLGGEVGLREILFARVGHAWSGDGRTGPSLGVGLQLERLRIDFGRSFDDFSEFDGDEPFQLSLGLRL
ncbi:MAG: hypothetical protein ACE5JR_07500 [Gemmatimonadota bacterium]